MSGVAPERLLLAGAGKPAQMSRYQVSRLG
jgi:hypothetical protein